ncbi:MAG: PAS domain S-box protein, partial [Magnetococcales bacterium]|nr:PAS domain S-box protein [Magnetococcales bacterium]
MRYLPDLLAMKWRFKSTGITAKMIIFFILLLSFTIILFSVHYARQQKATILAQNEQALNLLAATIGNGIHALMLSGNAPLAMMFVEAIRHNTEILDFRILRADGLEAFLDNCTIRLVNETIGQERFELKTSEHSTRILEADDPNLLNTLKDKRGHSALHQQDGQSVMTILAPIRYEQKCVICHGDQNRVLGIMRITTSLSQVEAEIRRTQFEALLLGAISMIVLVIVGYRMMHRLLILPLGQIEQSMERVAGGHLEERIFVPGEDELSRIAATFNDMASRLRVTYDGLQRERNTLSTIIHSVQEGIVVTDADSRVILVNPATERLLQKSAGQIESEGFLSLLDDPGYIRAFLDREGRDLPSTLGYKARYLHFHAATFRSEGQVIGSAALIRDITEEFRLREQFREIIRQAPFGIIVADDQGRMHLFNPAAERMFGQRQDDMIGKSILALIPPALAGEHEARFQRFFQQEDVEYDPGSTFETTALRRDGSTFPVRLAVNTMMLDGRLAIVGMISDITEERKMLDDLVQSAKMAGLGSMVAGVAHEINTPVGIGVTAASELKERTSAFENLVQSEGISEEELKECIDSTKRLTELTLNNLIRAAELVRSFKSVAVDQSSE